MDQQEQEQDNLSNVWELLQSDNNQEYLQILQPEFEVGHLYKYQNHKICKVLFNKLDCDRIIQNGLACFKEEIDQNKQSALLNKNSLLNSGIIPYINEGQLPSYYNHYNWECTLQNILLTFQENRELMNKQTALWISKSIAQVIELQHKQNIFLLNISIASVVFRKDFDFSFIQFTQKGNIEHYYKFILLNFSDTTQQDLKKPTIEKLEFFIKQKFNSLDCRHILQQGADIIVDTRSKIPADIPIDKRFDTSSDVQILIYQLRKHVEKYNQNQSVAYSIENINFDQLQRHLTVKITNFDCAQSQSQKGLSDVILLKIPLKQRHPYIIQTNFNFHQQDYLSLGIIMYWIFNHSQFAQLNQNQIPDKIQKEFRDQQNLRSGMNYGGQNQLYENYEFLNQIRRRNFIPEEFQGLLSDDLKEQKQAFKNVLNLQYDFGQIEKKPKFKQSYDDDYYQQ